MKLNKIIQSVIVCGGLLTIGGANAYTVDTKIGEALLANSGDATETQALADILNVDVTTLTLVSKLDTPNGAPAALNPGTLDQWFLDVDPNTPGYFMLKFGLGGNNVTATSDHFFFQNIAELTKLVWANSQVQFLSGGDCAENPASCNIERLSHYATFNGDDDGTIEEIPEPASIALVGLGLLGASLARRRRQV